jgi:uncharacterized membrane protein required for colicin V production
MNPVDALVGVYVGYGALRGRSRGLAQESYRLLRVGVALVAGCGLFGLVSDAISQLVHLGPTLSGPVGFLVTSVGAWSVMRVLREKFLNLMETRFSRVAEIGGAVAGALRTLALSSGAMITAHLAGSSGLLENSWLGRLMEHLPGL